jgi:hypothetical protein
MQSPLPIYGRFASNDFELSPIHAGFSDQVWCAKVGVFSKQVFLRTIFSHLTPSATSKNQGWLT